MGTEKIKIIKTILTEDFGEVLFLEFIGFKYVFLSKSSSSYTLRRKDGKLYHTYLAKTFDQILKLPFTNWHNPTFTFLEEEPYLKELLEEHFAVELFDNDDGFGAFVGFLPKDQI